MTSESATECYVYITLASHTAPVTAGRFTLTTDRRGNGTTSAWNVALDRAACRCFRARLPTDFQGIRLSRVSPELL
jgi:hypothetical protein